MNDRLLFLLSKVQYSITTHFKKELKKEGLGLTTGQFGILMVLDETGRTSMGNLSHTLDIDNSAITRLVDKMEKKGLVERQINLEDRRQMLVSITDSGQKQAVVLKRIARTANDRIREGFSDKEIDIFKKVGQSIIQKFSG